MLQAELKVIGGKQSGKVIPLTTQKFLIGREQDCHLRPNSELVSRHHCVFTQDDFGLRLRDLGSTNGTFVNGERLRGQVMLKAGDRVYIGKLDFEVLLREPVPVETAALPGPETADAPSESQDAPISAETTELSAADTSFDIPVLPSEGEAGADAGVVSGDTTIIMQQPPAPAYLQQPAMAYPQPPPAQYPPQVPYQPMPAPYPGAPQYPQQPQYPQYPQQPMAYPQQPFAYPQAPEQAAPMEADNGSVPVPPVHLPPPETTGLAPAQPPAEQDGDQGAQKPAEEKNPSQKAADIIKQYMHRRPDV